jgi:hypothetical protein
VVGRLVCMKRNSESITCSVFSYLVMCSGDKFLGHLSGVSPVHIVGYSIYDCEG